MFRERIFSRYASIMRSNNDCIKFFFLYFSNRLLMRSKNSDNQRACDRKSSTSKSNSLYLTENFVMIFLELSSLLQILELFSFFLNPFLCVTFFVFYVSFHFTYSSSLPVSELTQKKTRIM